MTASLEVVKENLGPLLLAIVAGAFLYRARKSENVSVADVVGPESPSFWIGNLGEVLRTQAGEKNLPYSILGGLSMAFAIRKRSSLQGSVRDRLLISDPKAVHHILQGYRWGASGEQRARNLFVAGPGVAYVHGEDHKRHRRIMNPAFGASESKALVPIFFAAASSLSNKWKDLLSVSSDQSEVFNIPRWTSRATLDAIGHGESPAFRTLGTCFDRELTAHHLSGTMSKAGFDYNFGAMENQDNRLSKAYHNLFADMFAAPSDSSLIVNSITALLPIKTMARLFEYLSKSDPRLAKGREAREVAREVARELVEEKSREILDRQGPGKGIRDVMSLLVKANMASKNERTKMSDEELYAQMLSIFIAGHETTANSISWILLEMSRHPEIQDKLRKEIREKERQLVAEGRSQSGFTAEDCDSLPYMNAVLKESMRYHPAAIRILRMALVDDCLPLSESIKTASGKEISEIPVSKGQRVMLSIAGYNRNKEVYGEDAHVFRPERWLENEDSKKGGTSIGVYANL
ncbi:hypothetical protein PQX77_011468 [Marasmius sp. AFHP31]|nr:hypothetical protein PQX77_011468 [Marasmius sp. AFHP31]